MIGVMLMQNGDVIKKIWKLFDTCYTDSVTNNLDYVEDVKNFPKHKELTLLSNGGSIIFDQKGQLTFLPLNLHVNENCPAAILCFKDAKQYSRSVRDYGYIDREGCEFDYLGWNIFQVQGMYIGFILL